jgi:hypothetical protein
VKSRIELTALMALAASFSTALAGGLLLYEVGTPDLGLASAGWAARAALHFLGANLRWKL